MATFGFNRTALRAIQPKLRSMFCAVFLKIALSAAELRFDTVGLLFVGYCHAYKPKTIDVLKDNIREAIGEIQLHTLYIMCLKIGPIV